MIFCNYLTDIYPKEMQGKCKYKKSIINLEDCNVCRLRLFNFSELKIGQFYFNVDIRCNYIKISDWNAFDLDNNKICYMGRHLKINNCKLCDYEVW